MRDNRLADQNRDSVIEDYLNEWERQLQKTPIVIETVLGDTLLSKAIADRLCKIGKFSISIHDDFKCKLDGKLIYRLDLHGRPDLILKNCAIREVVCRVGDSSARLGFINCWIGSLVIGQKSLSAFGMAGGGIDRIERPLPSEKNPFIGSVSIVGTRFSSDWVNAQAYRNLRHHLSEIHNQEAASVFHSAEMRTLFEQQNRLDKTFNLIYRGISDYGNSTTRPLWLFFYLPW